MAGRCASATLTLAMACAVLASSAGVPAQTPQTSDGAMAALVDRASQYVDAYVEAFSAIVSEERQTQKEVRADGRVKKVRELVSDFLLVKIPDSPWPAAFRDVISVDGKPVRNRDDRLRKLFLDNPNRKAVDLAAAISKEGGRYNLGVNRTGSSPLLPIIFLTKRIVPRVKFTMTGRGLAFEEVQRPSVLALRSGGKRFDLMSRGAFEIDAASGRVLAAEFAAAADDDTRVRPVYRVRYAQDAKLELSVPVEVTERYERSGKPGDDHLDVVSTYSAFRRFQVSTAEKIK